MKDDMVSVLNTAKLVMNVATDSIVYLHILSVLF